MNISAGKQVHCLEAVARVIVGMLGALLVALAVKADMLLGMINSSKEPFALLLTVCFVAGASERIVPSLIKQVEGMIEKKGDKTVLRKETGQHETG